MFALAQQFSKQFSADAIDKHAEERTTLITQNEQLQSRVVQLQSNIEVLRTENWNLCSEICVKGTENSKLKSEIVDKTEEVNDLRTEVEVLNGAIQTQVERNKRSCCCQIL